MRFWSPAKPLSFPAPGVCNCEQLPLGTLPGAVGAQRWRLSRAVGRSTRLREESYPPGPIRNTCPECPGVRQAHTCVRGVPRHVGIPGRRSQITGWNRGQLGTPESMQKQPSPRLPTVPEPESLELPEGGPASLGENLAPRLPFPLHPHPRPQYRWPFLPGALLLPGWGHAAPRDPAVQPWAHELAALHSFWKLWAARPVVRSQVWEGRTFQSGPRLVWRVSL